MYLNIYSTSINKGACLQEGHHNSRAQLFTVLHGGKDTRQQMQAETWKILAADKEK